MDDGMTYEGAIIRRLVTPNHPGDPKLDDPTTEIQCRMEYVKNDPPTRPGDWTKDVAQAFHYPRHLEADHRAHEIGGMAHARVMTADGQEPFSNLSPIRTGDGSRSPRQQIAAPAPVTNLPVEVRSSASAVKQRNLSQGSVRDNGLASRPAGKTFSKRKRLAALRASAKRLDKKPDQQWYQKGQYA